MLRKSGEILSGENLSAALGISRVSIWKHIRRLQEAGYEILPAGSGYRLLSSPDTPFPWEFPERSSQVHYYPEITSTMDMARDLARKEAPHFSVVVAGRQTAGRGRLNRSWHSADGGLYFTVTLRPAISPVFGFRATFAAGISMARTLNRMFSVKAGLKWPNDILVDGRKICGMLSEMEAEGEAVSFVNIGIGLNVNNDPASLEPAAVSLKEILRHEVSRKEILARFLDDFEGITEHLEAEDLISQWKHHSATLDRHVKIVTRKEAYEGLAVDLDPTGALVLKKADGTLTRVIHGDCFLK